MKVPGLGIAVALFLIGLAPTAAIAAGLSGSDGSTIHQNPESINRALAAADAPAILDADQHAKGKKEAPPLVAASKAPCTMTDAYYIGGGVGADKVHANYYEVSCKEGLGYILVAKDKNPVPEAVDCVKLSTKTPDGKPNPLACRLPGNRHPALGLQTVVTQAGHICTVSNGRYVGSTQDVDIYEVACGEGGGYILETSRNGSAGPKTTNCVIYASGGGIKCGLETEADQMVYVDKLVAASGKPCAIKARRYVGSTPDGADFYEVACNDGAGFMVKSAPNGGFAEQVDCLKAAGIGDGCKLTDTRQAQTQQNNLYSSLSKKAGFDCAVSKYADFPSSDSNTEIVELACGNRPDGGVGFFPATGAGRVLDCLRSEAEGYKCTYTPTSALYAKLTAQLRAKNKTSCVVSNAAAFAEATSKGGVGKDDLVEVACADGGPGYVLDYLYGQTEPAELLNCAQVVKMGGCKLSK
jgi:hypothetical protein